MDEKIIGIQVFEYDVPSCFHYAHGKMIKCRYGLLKITTSEQTGWGECIMSINENQFDLIKWSTFLYKLKNMSLKGAYKTIQLHKALWGKAKTELVEMALLDLIARLQKKKFSEFIGIQKEAAVTSLVVQKNTIETFHIHPGCKGTLIETVNYAQSLRQKGVKLLMHKDYLIGPACTAWQLAAVGLGAEWLETDEYLEPRRLSPLIPTEFGTGFQLDVSLLLEESQAYFSVI